MKKWLKNPLTFLGLSILSMFLHNLVYALTRFEEPVFFILTLAFALAFIIFSIIWLIKKLS